MAESVNVRISGKLKYFILQQVGINGLYESASEYIRDLIRRDYEQQEKYKWDQLYKHLEDGMNADETDFEVFNPDEIIALAKKEKS
jgi:antitoxin ParD1/3/4